MPGNRIHVGILCKLPCLYHFSPLKIPVFVNRLPNCQFEMIFKIKRSTINCHKVPEIKTKIKDFLRNKNIFYVELNFSIVF